MYPTTNTGSQMIPGSMFGSAYIAERHFDDSHAYFAPVPKRTVDFDAVLRTLRSALSLLKS